MGERDTGFRAGGKDYHPSPTQRDSGSPWLFVGVIVVLAILGLAYLLWGPHYSAPPASPASSAASASKAG